MRSALRLTASAAVISLLCIPIASASVADAATGHGAGRMTTILPAGVLPGLAKYATGAKPKATTPLQVTVSLTNPNASSEAAMLRAMYTKGSADYHEFLTPQTYAEHFGVPAATVSRVETSLTADGMSVVYAAPNGDLLTLSGDLSQAAKTFDVSFKDYRAPNGYRFWANSNAPTVPIGVDVVTGLTSIPAFHLDTMGRQTLCPPAAASGPCVGAVTPQDLWSVYDMPSTDTGEGQKIGVIGAGDYVQVAKDLRQFEGEFNLPKVNIVEHNVADDLSYTSGEGEWAMDSEASTGMAPGVSEIDYYFADGLGDADAFAAWANDPNGPLQANFSVGGCESLDLELGTVAQDDPLFSQLALEGRTLFASTGDTGGSCTVVTGNGFLNTGAPQVEYPASSPYVVGVGGTTLYTTGDTPNSRAVENGWSHTGGGTSIMEPRPAWQDGIGNVTEPGQCVLDPTGNPVTGDVPCKGIPDVAAMSGDITVLTEEAGRSVAGNGYQDVEDGNDGADGGTSLASPLWVGMWTRMQAAAAEKGGTYPGLGFAAPLLYNTAYNATEDDNDFYNVAIGTNGQWHDNPRTSLDPTGWSYVSGLGVPNVAPLTKDLTGSDSAANTSVPAPTGTTTTVTATTGSCGQNGVVTNSSPAGIADGLGPDDESLDMQQVVITYDQPSNTVQWQATVKNLSANPELGKGYAFSFADGKDDYQLLASTDQTGQDFELDSLTPGGAEETASGEDTVTRLSALPGSFDTAANTITVSLPLSTFDKLVPNTDALQEGETLTGLTDQSFPENANNPVATEETVGYAQEFSDTCGYVIIPAGGSAELPEAPNAGLIGIAGLVVVGVAAVVRRRRRAHG